LLDRILGRRGLVEALMGDGGSATALLDGRGNILRAGGGWDVLPPVGSCVGSVLADPAPDLLARALKDRRDLRLTTRAGGAPAALSLTALRRGRVAGVLRLISCAREHELEEALGQAQRLHEVGELAGGIAHDFNNLLTAIIGAADDLSARAVAADREDLAQIRASAGRGAELVRQLLAFGQRQTLQPRVLVLDEAVSQAAQLLRRLLSRHISLVLDLNAPARRVLMDATQLDQVLVNLAVNARNAMPQGGTLRIATDWRLVLREDDPGPDALPPGRYATIEVCDTGTGIPAELLPRIFDPFFTTRRESGGTGLGLSMVQGIIRQSGGTLTVESVQGQGTCFRITLPRYEGAAEAPARPPPAVVSPPAPRDDDARVLLVDDDDAIRRLAARALSRAGCVVIQADGAEAALAVDLAAVDCVVSDVTMPGMDGPSLVRALRGRRPGLPALLISGYADAEQRRALAGEDIAFLAKPFRMAALTGAVGRLLAERAVA
jgi:two-component system cell cycle sensor histidine kinase/response regulator CckA